MKHKPPESYDIDDEDGFGLFAGGGGRFPGPPGGGGGRPGLFLAGPFESSDVTIRKQSIVAIH